MSAVGLIAIRSPLSLSNATLLTCPFTSRCCLDTNCLATLRLIRWVASSKYKWLENRVPMMKRNPTA